MTSPDRSPIHTKDYRPEYCRELLVSRDIIHDTYDYFLPYRRAQVETACFWFGLEVGDRQVATTLALPQLRQSRGRYAVIPDSLRRLSIEMRRQGLTNLAQVHTHPSKRVGHSAYDDERAYSTRDGALSLVWPRYGGGLEHDLVGVGIHEMRAGRWQQLTEEQSSSRIRIVDSVVDMRWSIEPETDLDES